MKVRAKQFFKRLLSKKARSLQCFQIYFNAYHFFIIKLKFYLRKKKLEYHYLNNIRFIWRPPSLSGFIHFSIHTDTDNWGLKVLGPN